MVIYGTKKLEDRLEKLRKEVEDSPLNYDPGHEVKESLPYYLEAGWDVDRIIMDTNKTGQAIRYVVIKRFLGGKPPKKAAAPKKKVIPKK